MIVLICGGRDFTDRFVVAGVLDRIAKKHFDDNGGKTDEYGNWMPLDSFEIIHGDAQGADQDADDWATINWVKATPFPVTDEEWKRLGKAAGPIRNRKMLQEGKPDLVIAFPGHEGTDDMKKQARKAGVEVKEFDSAGGEIIEGDLFSSLGK